MSGKFFESLILTSLTLTFENFDDFENDGDRNETERNNETRRLKT